MVHDDNHMGLMLALQHFKTSLNICINMQAPLGLQMVKPMETQYTNTLQQQSKTQDKHESRARQQNISVRALLYESTLWFGIFGVAIPLGLEVISSSFFFNGLSASLRHTDSDLLHFTAIDCN